MLLYAGNQVSLFASIEALKRHFAPGKFYLPSFFLLGRFIGVKKFCVLGNNELYTVMLLFLSLNFVGAIRRNLEVIIFWIGLT